ncbi:hypothetical protein ymoll0001_41190 [Yersinia mollaretii ATCC 43969]|uniref:Filamentous hemagglutinin n=1 Tax=Yersinia mollaretii (strain ATCC 43969 / DSM 18520 / CIP 103324 / CNY 7263 / WAIP 204) TaxID=349967 RepID=A0ABM9Y4F0_YERMW|nr:hypothetical protein [Yersinia mollaretii]EEQ08594.1 hypothetical protein ymoll0001_41190 [Yersinia mollaretii ATCC 43969]QKJ03176.1 filamentous hemagglutinin [Yersinia mollaretii ATCC 43969]
MEAHYQRAGASAAYESGVEAGKLLFEFGGYAVGVGGLAKGGVRFASKQVDKFRVKGTTVVIAEYGPLNKGPLTEQIAGTFRSGSYKENITTEPTTLYRVYGGNSGELGAYWTRVKPTGPVQSVIDSALDPKWGNTATKVVEIKMPAGVKFYEGTAAQQSGLVGGGNQVYISGKVDPSWIVK